MNFVYTDVRSERGLTEEDDRTIRQKVVFEFLCLDRYSISFVQEDFREKVVVLPSIHKMLRSPTISGSQHFHFLIRPF